MPPLNNTEPRSLAPLSMGKFTASRLIVKQSWQILKNDKEIMLFPIASAVTSLIAFVIFAIICFFVIFGGNTANFQNGGQVQVNGLSYVIIFLYYLVMAFIVNFFQAGIFVIVHATFKGERLTFGDGIRGALNNAGKIFAWSLILATVGFILRIIADRFKIVGRIVAAILGAAWNILTYFSLPSLIVGHMSVRDSFKESAAIIRRTWGEVIIINLGVGFFFAVLIFIGVALAVGISVLAPLPAVIIVVALLLTIFIVFISIISSSLSSIFKLALYEYAHTGTIPPGFSPELIEHAIKAN